MRERTDYSRSGRAPRADPDKIFLNLGDTAVMKFLIKFLHYSNDVVVGPTAEERQKQSVLDKEWNHRKLNRDKPPAPDNDKDFVKKKTKTEKECPQYSVRECPGGPEASLGFPKKLSRKERNELNENYNEKMAPGILLDEAKCQAFWYSRNPTGTRQLTVADYREFTGLKTHSEREAFLKKLLANEESPSPGGNTVLTNQLPETEPDTEGGQRKFRMYCTLRYNKDKVPHHVEETIEEVDTVSFIEKLWECGTIVYDVTTYPDQIKEAGIVLQCLADEFDEWAEEHPLGDLGPRRFILVSPCMTWALTQPLNADVSGEEPLIEEYYKKRKPHPKYKEHYQLENKVISVGCKYRDVLKTLVVCSGCIYGHGENVLEGLFREGWLNIQEMPVFGQAVNRVPLIYDADLAHIILHFIIDFPQDTKYVFAIENRSPTQLELVKAVLSNLTDGRVKIYPPEASVKFNFNAELLEVLTTDLNLEANYLKRVLNWTTSKNFVRDAKSIVDQYRKHYRLSPIKILLMGPQTIGKTIMAKNLCKYYNLTYISPRREIKLYMRKLRWVIGRKKLEAKIEKERKKKEKAKTVKSRGRPDTQQSASKPSTALVKPATSKSKKLTEKNTTKPTAKPISKKGNEAKSGRKTLTMSQIKLTPFKEQNLKEDTEEAPSDWGKTKIEKMTTKISIELNRMKEKYREKIRKKIRRQNALSRLKRPTRSYLRRAKMKRHMRKAARLNALKSLMTDKQQTDQASVIYGSSINTLGRSVGTISSTLNSINQSQTLDSVSFNSSIPSLSINQQKKETDTKKTITIKIKGYGPIAETLRSRSVLLPRKVKLKKKILASLLDKAPPRVTTAIERKSGRILRNLEKIKAKQQSPSYSLIYRKKTVGGHESIYRIEKPKGQSENGNKARKTNKKVTKKNLIFKTKDKKRRDKLRKCRKLKRRRQELRHRIKVGKPVMKERMERAGNIEIKQPENIPPKKIEVPKKGVRLHGKEDAAGTAGKKRWERELGFIPVESRETLGRISGKVAVKNYLPVSSRGYRLITCRRTTTSNTQNKNVAVTKANGKSKRGKPCGKTKPIKKPELKPKGRITRTLQFDSEKEEGVIVKRYNVQTRPRAEAVKRRRIKRQVRTMTVLRMREVMKNHKYVKNRHDILRPKRLRCHTASFIRTAAKFKEVFKSIQPNSKTKLKTELDLFRKQEERTSPEARILRATDPDENRRHRQAEYRTQILENNSATENKNLLSGVVQESKKRARDRKAKHEKKRMRKKLKREEDRKSKTQRTDEPSGKKSSQTDRSTDESEIERQRAVVNSSNVGDRNIVIEINIVREGEETQIRGEFYLQDLLDAFENGKEAAERLKNTNTKDGIKQTNESELSQVETAQTDCCNDQESEPESEPTITETSEPSDMDGSKWSLQQLQWPSVITIGRSSESRSNFLQGLSTDQSNFYETAPPQQPDKPTISDKGVLILKINILDNAATIENSSLQGGTLWKQILDFVFGENFRKECERLEKERRAQIRQKREEHRTDRKHERQLEEISRQRDLVRNKRKMDIQVESVGKKMEPKRRKRAIAEKKNYHYCNSRCDRPNPRIIGDYRAKHILNMKPIKRIIENYGKKAGDETSHEENVEGIIDYTKITSSRSFGGRVATKSIVAVKINLKEENLKSEIVTAKEKRKTVDGKFMYLCRKVVPFKYEEEPEQVNKCRGTTRSVNDSQLTGDNVNQIISTDVTDGFIDKQGNSRARSEVKDYINPTTQMTMTDDTNDGRPMTVKRKSSTDLCHIYVLHTGKLENNKGLMLEDDEEQGCWKPGESGSNRQVITKIIVRPTDPTLMKYARLRVRVPCVRVINGKSVTSEEWAKRTGKTMPFSKREGPAAIQWWRLRAIDWTKVIRTKRMRRLKRRRRHLIRRRRECRRERRVRRLLGRSENGDRRTIAKRTRRLKRQRRRQRRALVHRRLRRDLRRLAAAYRSHLAAARYSKLVKRYRERLRTARRNHDFRYVLLTRRSMLRYRRRRRQARFNRQEADPDIRRLRETRRLIGARMRGDPRAVVILRRLRKLRRPRQQTAINRPHRRAFRRHRRIRKHECGRGTSEAVEIVQQLRERLPRRLDLSLLNTETAPSLDPLLSLTRTHPVTSTSYQPVHQRDLIHPDDPRRGRHMFHGVIRTDLGYLSRLRSLRTATVLSERRPDTDPAELVSKRQPESRPCISTVWQSFNKLHPSFACPSQQKIRRVPSRKFKKIIAASINKIKNYKDKIVFLKKATKLICNDDDLRRFKMSTLKREGDLELDWNARKENVENEPDPYPKPLEYYKQTLRNIRRQLKTFGTVNNTIITKLLRKRILSKPSQNQGFILDTFPLTYSEAKKLSQPLNFGGEVDDENTVEINGHSVDRRILPDWVFNIEASDRALMSNKQYFGHRKLNQAKAINKAMANIHKYRLLSSKLESSMDFYEELNIYPHLFNIGDDPSPVFSRTITGISSMVGKPKTHGVNLKGWLKRLEKQYRRHDRTVKTRKRKKKSTQEKSIIGPDDVGSDEEHFPKKELVKSKEWKKRLLEMHGYLSRHVLDILTNALCVLIRLRPEDPIDFMARYIVKRNRAGLTPRWVAAEDNLEGLEEKKDRGAWGAGTRIKTTVRLTSHDREDEEDTESRKDGEGMTRMSGDSSGTSITEPWSWHVADPASVLYSLTDSSYDTLIFDGRRKSRAIHH